PQVDRRRLQHLDAAFEGVADGRQGIRGRRQRVDPLGADHPGDDLVDQRIAEVELGAEMVEEGPLGQMEPLEEAIDAGRLKAVRVDLLDPGDEEAGARRVPVTRPSDHGANIPVAMLGRNRVRKGMRLRAWLLVACVGAVAYAGDDVAPPSIEGW